MRHYIVWDTESERPEPVGLFFQQVEDTVVYNGFDGEQHHAPIDCVAVLPLRPPWRVSYVPEAALAIGRCPW